MMSGFFLEYQEIASEQHFFPYSGDQWLTPDRTGEGDGDRRHRHIRNAQTRNRTHGGSGGARALS